MCSDVSAKVVFVGFDQAKIVEDVRHGRADVGYEEILCSPHSFYEHKAGGAGFCEQDT